MINQISDILNSIAMLGATIAMVVAALLGVYALHRLLLTLFGEE